MKILLRAASAAVLILACMPAISGAQDIPDMDIPEVQALLDAAEKAQQPLMGTAKSVPEGITPIEYQVRIRGVLRQGSMVMIIFTMQHNVAAGMSGSPAYLQAADGTKKLIGALGYSLAQFSPNEHWGGISPIKYMREEASSVSVDGKLAFHGKTTVQANVSWGKKIFTPIPLGTETISEDAIRRSGISSEFAEFIRQNKFVIRTAQSGTGSSGIKFPQKLTAGMPIVVDLLEWEDQNGKVVTVGALGTITHAGSDGRIYAFGHPFLGARYVTYPFRTCRVMGTVISDQSSFKLTGEISDIRGAIKYDAAFGIYGTANPKLADALMPFTVSLGWAGESAKKFTVRLAQANVMPYLFSVAFQLLGEAGNAPLTEEASTTEMSVKVGLAGYPAIEYADVFQSGRHQNGPQTAYFSSYDVARDRFLSDIYMPLKVSTFNFAITDVNIAFTFSGGVKQRLKVAGYRFPQKVKYNQTPELELLLVAEDNSATFSRAIPVVIDWTKVEEPIYSADIRKVQKDSEKIVSGMVAIYSPQFTEQYLTKNETDTQNPEYFLNANDFLGFFNRQLARTTQKILVKAFLTGKSDVPAGESQDAGSILPQGGQNENGWSVRRQGLAKRAKVQRDQGAVTFYPDVPVIPGGYTIAPININISFEVVR